MAGGSGINVSLDDARQIATLSSQDLTAAIIYPLIKEIVVAGSNLGRVDDDTRNTITLNAGGGGAGGGLSAVSSDSTLVGEGTSASALRVAYPFTPEDGARLDSALQRDNFEDSDNTFYSYIRSGIDPDPGSFSLTDSTCGQILDDIPNPCLLYTSPSPRDS